MVLKENNDKWELFGEYVWRIVYFDNGRGSAHLKAGISLEWIAGNSA